MIEPFFGHILSNSYLSRTCLSIVPECPGNISVWLLKMTPNKIPIMLRIGSPQNNQRGIIY